MNIWKLHQKLENLRGLLSFVPRKIVQISLVFGTDLLITIAGYDIPAMVAVSKDTSNYVTFTDWCLNKETLQSGTRGKLVFLTANKLARNFQRSNCSDSQVVTFLTSDR
jgi:hypothetical protein